MNKGSSKLTNHKFEFLLLFRKTRWGLLAILHLRPLLFPPLDPKINHKQDLMWPCSHCISLGVPIKLGSNILCWYTAIFLCSICHFLLQRNKKSPLEESPLCLRDDSCHLQTLVSELLHFALLCLIQLAAVGFRWTVIHVLWTQTVASGNRFFSVFPFIHWDGSLTLSLTEKNKNKILYSYELWGVFPIERAV